MQTRQSEFAPGSFFWNSFVPDFFALLTLFEATGETRYRDAARESALRFTQFIWLCPTIPTENITVNQGGKAPVYSYLAKRTKGPMPVPEETVPAWRLSEIGLTAEASGTSTGHRGIFLTCFAPWLLRIAALTGDTFLHDLARAAIVGRYASFPGYHMNTARTTVYEKPDYPLHPFEALSYNSFHFNHGWPHIALVLDYLISEVETRTRGAIRFPARYAEGYAYLKNRIYGDRPGEWKGEKDVWLWMPRGLLAVSSPQVNYIAARGNGALYLALTNQSSEPVNVTLTLNKALLPGLKESQRKMRIAPNGIATLKIPGVQIQPAFQQELLGAGGSAWAQDEAKTPFIQGKVVGMILNFGPTHQFAFVYLQGTYQEIREARLLYQIDRAPEQTRTDSRYPFEFTITLPPDATSFTYHVEAVTTSGALQKTGNITLRREP